MIPKSLIIRINHALNVRSEEWPRLSLLVLMLYLMVVGNIWGRSTVYGAFLEHVGVGALPTLLVANALLSLGAVAVYTVFADRVSNDRLLLAILLVLLAGMIGGRFLLAENLTAPAYTLLYLLYLVIVESIFFLHWWTYVNGYYDTRAAKRIVPIVAAAARVASIVAGLTMRPLNRLLTPPDVVAIWLVLLAAVAVLAYLMPVLLNERRRTAPAERAGLPTEESSGYIATLREGRQTVAGSPFLRWMGLSTLLLVIFIPVVNYQTSAIFSAELQSSSAIADFTALLIGVTNLVLLPVQLFLLGRFINKVGLGNANLLYPAGSVAIIVALVGIPSLSTAALGFLDRTVFRATFRNPTDSLLYNAVPLRVKGRVRAFVSGWVVPIGSLIGSGLLLLPLVENTTWFVPGLLVVLAGAYVVSALGVRRRYGQALMDLLEREDYSFLLDPEASELQAADPAMLDRLRQRLEQSESDEFTIFMARLVAEVGAHSAGNEAVSLLADVAQDANSHVRATVLDVLAATETGSEAALRLFISYLNDDNAGVRHSALVALERVAGAGDPEFLRHAENMLADEDPEVCAVALTPLLAAGGMRRKTAVSALRQMLAGAGADERLQAVRAVARTGNAALLSEILPRLNDDDDPVRLETAVAIEELSDNGISPTLEGQVLQAITPAVADPVERVRQAALRVLGRVGGNVQYPLLVERLGDVSPLVRETAVDVLVGIGKGVIPAVHPQLDADEPQLRKMASLVLGRIDPGEFGALISTQITGSLLAIYSQYNMALALAPLQQYPSLNLLAVALREENRRLLAEIFVLLTALKPDADVAVIHSSLESSDSRTRANALEALEALTSPQTARLVAPLFADEGDGMELLAVAREMWEVEPLDARQTVEQLVNEQREPWLRALAVYALGEIGAVLARPSPPEPKPPPPSAPDPPSEKKPRRRNLDDVLAALGDDDPPRKRRPDAASLLDALSDDVDTAPGRNPGPAPPAAELETVYQPPPAIRKRFHVPFVMGLLQTALRDGDESVQAAAQHARAQIEGKTAVFATLDGRQLGEIKEERTMLSVIERIIFLKEVLFFQEMTIDQLKVLANVCEEAFFPADSVIYQEGDPGGVLYVVVRGKVGIERAGRRKGSVARLATVEAHAYFGEMNLFDESPRSASAVALQDTLCLTLRREPLIALARQQPELSLSLINVLSQRLRQTTERVAELTRTQPRELHQLFDQLDN